MSLKHELNHRGDGRDLSPVERLDARLTELADGWAERWQARTPFSRQHLTLALYLAATLAGLAYVALTRELLFLGIAFLAYVGSAPGRQRGSLIEEIQLEAAGLPPGTLRYLAVFMLGLGLFGICSSLPFVVGDLLTAGAPGPQLPGIVGGLAIVALKAADYIARTNPSRRDGDRERPIEKVRQRSAVAVGAPA
jgi:hypothetical protein